MAVAQVRQANPGDAANLAALIQTLLGPDYPAKEIYDPAWLAVQLDPASGHETWLAEVDGVLSASISFLKPASGINPILNLGRAFFRPESYSDESAKTLLHAVNQIANERGQVVITRIPANDNKQQILFESFDYSCTGFQPFKHMLQNRLGILFYVRQAHQILMTRTPLSESLPQIGELAALAFERLKISNPMSVRDGAVGYPLQTELKVHDATFDDYQLWKAQVQATNPPIEISTGFNIGLGLMRIDANVPIQSILAQRENQIVAGIALYYDEHDRCVRFMDGFAADDISMGAVFQHAVKIAQEQFNAVYVEVDILAVAPRLLKTAEQLGFVPVAYLPALYVRNNAYADVVKLIKLNMPYALDGVEFTAEARLVAEIVDRNFQDQKVGIAIINLLRGLPIFEGLGDGELRKIARLFTQKLYRPGEQIFKRGDVGDSAYVVMRGQIDILAEEGGKPLASVSSGKIFGEFSLLDGAPRSAFTVAGQASIVLVVQRNALHDLVQREPHLGMVIMRNIALDLSNKLRLANTTIATLKQGTSIK